MFKNLRDHNNELRIELRLEEAELQFKIDTVIQRKSNIDAELVIYRDQEIAKINTEIADIRVMCSKQIAELEHEYHQGKEIKMTELAKLDGLIEARKEYITMHEKTISTLKEVIASFQKHITIKTIE